MLQYMSHAADVVCERCKLNFSWEVFAAKVLRGAEILQHSLRTLSEA